MASTDTKANEDVVEACRKLEIARGQEAELEALLVFASSVLAPEMPMEDLPESIQDVHDEIRQIYPADIKTTAIFPPPGQFGKAVETQVVSSAIHSAAQQAADIFTNRLTEGPALAGLIDKIRRDNLQKFEQSYSHEHHPFLPILDQRLAELRLYHARHGTNSDLRQKRLVSDGFDLGARARQEWLAPIANDTLFSAAEVLGKYLDLEQSTWISTLQQICRSKNDGTTTDTTTFDYLDFLQALAQGLDNLPEGAKLAYRKNYERFLIQLEEYLMDYLKRTSPLLDVAKEIVAPVISKSLEKVSEGIDLAKYDSVDALQKDVETDTLKAELTRLGLKCGGTPNDRAKRLWMTKGKDPSEWPAKIKAKGASVANATAVAVAAAAAPPKGVPLAQRERVVMALLDQVRPELEATIKRMERQQGQTLAERETEITEDLYGSAVVPTKKRKTSNEDDDEEEDDDEDAPIYNPKNVPLDWDGKPIPYWLYKLHGLQHVSIVPAWENRPHNYVHECSQLPTLFLYRSFILVRFALESLIEVAATLSYILRIKNMPRA